jgi:hypothetical protein
MHLSIVLSFTDKHFNVTEACFPLGLYSLNISDIQVFDQNTPEQA